MDFILYIFLFIQTLLDKIAENCCKSNKDSQTQAILHPRVSFSSCQRNLIKTFQIEDMIALITKSDLDFFFRLVKWPKIAVKKSQNFQKF